MSEKKIIITTGGTGGHFFPAIATAEILLNRGYEVHLIIDLRCKKYLNSDLKFIIHIIDCKIEYKNYLTKLLSVIRIFKGSVKSLFLLYRIKPSVIVGFGSYATFPPMLAGLILRIPIVIHEQNCFMGKVNRLFTRFARNICISYKETKNFNRIYEDKIVVTGSIIRENIRNIKIKDDFSNNPFRIFIFGGSQGAKVFSNLIPQTIKLLIQLNPNVKLYITQQATKNEQIELSRIYTDIGVEHNLSEFFHDMDKQYEIQDLVISRSGASTIAELSAIGLPAIFIPYPFATENHQFYNAKALEDSGASWCFSQSTITAEILANKLLELISNRNILQQASNNLLKRQSYGSKILSDTIERIIV